MQARCSVARFNWEESGEEERRDGSNDGEVASLLDPRKAETDKGTREKERRDTANVINTKRLALLETPAANWSNFAPRLFTVARCNRGGIDARQPFETRPFFPLARIVIISWNVVVAVSQTSLDVPRGVLPNEECPFPGPLWVFMNKTSAIGIIGRNTVNCSFRDDDFDHFGFINCENQ